MLQWLKRTIRIMRQMICHQLGHGLIKIENDTAECLCCGLTGTFNDETREIH